jgi:hypothetical protein
MNMSKISTELTKGLEPPVSDVCRELMDQLASTPRDELRRLTYLWLAKLVHRQWDDDVFQSALTALTTMRNHPLTLYFVMYDPVEDRELSISAGDAMRSFDEREFIHPRTGEAVPNFENSLIPVFRASDEFLGLLAQNGD